MEGPPQSERVSPKGRLDAVFGKSVVVGEWTFATGTEKSLVIQENCQGVLNGYYSSRRVGVMIVLRHRASALPDYCTRWGKMSWKMGTWVHLRLYKAGH